MRVESDAGNLCISYKASRLEFREQARVSVREKPILQSLPQLWRYGMKHDPTNVEKLLSAKLSGRLIQVATNRLQPEYQLPKTVLL